MALDDRPDRIVKSASHIAPLRFSQSSRASPLPPVWWPEKVTCQASCSWTSVKGCCRVWVSKRGEWLAYGVARVPGLYEEVLNGEVERFGRGGTVRIIDDRGVEVPGADKYFQQPSLFDFRKRQGKVMLMEIN